MSSDSNMRLVPYSQGIGSYEEIEVIKSGLVNEFNEILEAKLGDGWRLVQDIRTMNHSNNYFYAVIAKSKR